MALLSAALKPVLASLGSEVWKRVQSHWRLDQDVAHMTRTLESLTLLLSDAERRSFSDDLVAHWLRRLTDMAYDLDDLLDDVQLEEQRRSRPSRSAVTDFFSGNNQIAFQSNIAGRIKEIKVRLDEINEEKDMYRFLRGEGWDADHPGRDDLQQAHQKRETYSALDSQVFGRREDLEKIVSFVLETGNDEKLSVLAVVGAGGMGKTTLAKMVVNDERVKQSFRHLDPIWVHVPLDLDQKETINKIIEGVTGNRCDLSSMEAMRRSVCGEMGGKKFLLVLDDIWCEDQEKWEALKSVLCCGGSGSKVIVTTRSEEVARMMGATNPHKLQPLEFDRCWDLFSLYAFQNGRQIMTPVFEEIGKEIVRKCGGMPLAAKSLGSLMADREGDGEWLAIRDSEIWTMSKAQNHILPALQLSYDHLPPLLKRCFAYCSLFPKGHIFDKKKLIWLWIAEGFFSSSVADVHMEANRCFKDLAWRSFFNEPREEEYGEYSYCDMHDVIHDLACFVARNEFSAVRTGAKPYTWRYVLGYGYCHDGEKRMDEIFQAKKLRTFIFQNHGLLNIADKKDDMFWGFSFLRVLYLWDSQIEELPDKFDRLRHLRAIDLSSCNIIALPDSITSLQNLQMLNLHDCGRLKTLPRDMSKMTSLKSLDIDGCYGLDCLPSQIGRLNKLETLSSFLVDKKPGCSSLAELQHLNLLRGKLRIKGLDKVEDAEEAGLANLRMKTRLTSLELIWDCFLTLIDDDREKQVQVLESLQLPPNLKQLVIKGYAGSRFPGGMMVPYQPRCYQNLLKVSLNFLSKCESLPPLGSLSLLKTLDMFQMDALTSIGTEFYGDGGTFPSLEILKINSMRSLKQWHIPTTEGAERMYFPRLKLFSISCCPQLEMHPCLPSVQIEMFDSNEQLLSAASLRGLSKLKVLCIESGAPSSRSNFWEGLGFLTSLEELRIGPASSSQVLADNITTLPACIMGLQFPSLKKLELDSLNDLESLSPVDMSWEEDAPPLCHSPLQSLHISWCLKLKALPEWLGRIPTLQELKLSGCVNLAISSAGLHRRLSSLQKFTVIHCPILEEQLQRRNPKRKRIEYQARLYVL